LPDNSILITANMQSETGFPSSHQLKSYVASKSCLKLACVLSCQRMLAFLLQSGVPRQRHELQLFKKILLFLNES